MKYFRIFLLLAALTGWQTNSHAQKVPAAKALIKRTYYDYAGRQLHEEYQYVSTPTNRYSKQGYYKEYNEDGTLWRKHQYRNNKAEGRQLEYSTTDGETWLEYDMMVHNALLNGPYIKYDGPNDKRLAGSYVNGEKAGTWIEYGSDGSQQATYYVHNEPYTGTLEEKFASGKLRRSAEYYKGMRFGLTQNWYPSGQLKSQTHYRYDKPDSDTLGYDENGEPDADTKTALAQADAEVQQARADSILRAQNLALAADKAALLRHQRDSLRLAEQVAVATRKAAQANTGIAEQLLLEVRSKRDGFAFQNATEMGAPVYKLYNNVYSKLNVDYHSTTVEADKVARAKRLLALMNLVEELRASGPYGQQRNLWEAIRKETDLDKLLALTGL